MKKSRILRITLTRIVPGNANGKLNVTRDTFVTDGVTTVHKAETQVMKAKRRDTKEMLTVSIGCLCLLALATAVCVLIKFVC